MESVSAHLPVRWQIWLEKPELYAAAGKISGRIESAPSRKIQVSVTPASLHYAYDSLAFITSGNLFHFRKIKDFYIKAKICAYSLHTSFIERGHIK